MVDIVYTGAYAGSMASIHVRIDDKLKKNAQKILRRIGLDLSGAFTLYLQHIILNEKLPFTPSAKAEEPILCSSHCAFCRKYRLRPGRTVNGWKSEQEERMVREADADLEAAIRKGEIFTPDALFAKWDAEDGKV